MYPGIWNPATYLSVCAIVLYRCLVFMWACKSALRLNPRHALGHPSTEQV